MTEQEHELDNKKMIEQELEPTKTYTSSSSLVFCVVTCLCYFDCAKKNAITSEISNRNCRKAQLTNITFTSFFKTCNITLFVRVQIIIIL